MQHGKAHYPLKEVKALIKGGNWHVNEDALDDAMEDFGWNKDDVRSAFLALQPCHWYKSEWSRVKPGVMLDYYKARGLRGENVYTHFYVDNEEVFLVINSFKKI